MQTVFGPRRRDRIRFLVPCFRALGLLGSSGGKAFSQDHPKGDINCNLFDLRFFEILGCPEASLWSNFPSFFYIFLRLKNSLILGNFGQGPAAGGGAPVSFRF